MLNKFKKNNSLRKLYKKYFYQYPNKNINEVFVYRIYNNKIENLLLENNINIDVIFNYLFFNKNDNSTVFDKPGLYRIVNPSLEKSTQFFISSNSIHLDCQNLMHVFVRGNSDDYLSYLELEKSMRKRKLILTCGNVTDFVISLFRKWYPSLKTRKVYLITNKDFNYYNDGHTLMEYYDVLTSRWKVVDFNRSCIYYCKNGYATAYDLISTSCKELKVHSVCQLDPSFSDDVNDYNYTFFEEYIMSKEGIKYFHKRIFQLLIVVENGNLYSVQKSKEIKNKVLKLYPNLEFLDSGIFINRFYGD